LRSFTPVGWRFGQGRLGWGRTGRDHDRARSRG
jgi:hypothetical protein